MARRRTRSRARPRSYFRRLRRRGTRKIPFELAITAGAIPFVKANDGFTYTPLQAIQAGKYEDAMRSLMDGLTPIGWYGDVDIIRYLNPFDMSRGRYMKMLLYAGLASKVRKRVVKIPFDRIPIVGRYVS